MVNKNFAGGAAHPRLPGACAQTKGGVTPSPVPATRRVGPAFYYGTPNGSQIVLLQNHHQLYSCKKIKSIDDVGRNYEVETISEKGKSVELILKQNCYRHDPIGSPQKLAEPTRRRNQIWCDRVFTYRAMSGGGAL